MGCEGWMDGLGRKVRWALVVMSKVWWVVVGLYPILPSSQRFLETVRVGMTLK